MIKVCIIGSGNVAHHLFRAFDGSDVKVIQVYSRNEERLGNFPASIATSDISLLAPADLFIIAVSDDAVSGISEQIPFQNTLIAHTSGSVALDANLKRPGVFYPLQTFSTKKEIDFQSVPICIEANSEDDFQLLEKVALAISKKVIRMDSEQRKALHIAAVFVSNFTNRMYSLAARICNENKLSFDLLKPLIIETASKVQTIDPDAAQTGPAKRNDLATITAHLDFLDGESKEIYKIMTQSIQNG